MSFDKIFDLTAGVYFNFHNMYIVFIIYRMYIDSYYYSSLMSVSRCSQHLCLPYILGARYRCSISRQRPITSTRNRRADSSERVDSSTTTINSSDQAVTPSANK